jgi:hypothetical protein
MPLVVQWLSPCHFRETVPAEAVFESSGDPIHLPFGNADLSAPALIPAAFKRLTAVLTGLAHRSSQNFTPGYARMPFRNGCSRCSASIWDRGVNRRAAASNPLAT